MRSQTRRDYVGAYGFLIQSFDQRSDPVVSHVLRISRVYVGSSFARNLDFMCVAAVMLNSTAPGEQWRDAEGPIPPTRRRESECFTNHFPFTFFPFGAIYSFSLELEDSFI